MIDPMIENDPGNLRALEMTEIFEAENNQDLLVVENDQDLWGEEINQDLLVLENDQDLLVEEKDQHLLIENNQVLLAVENDQEKETAIVRIDHMTENYPWIETAIMMSVNNPGKETVIEMINRLEVEKHQEEETTVVLIENHPGIETVLEMLDHMKEKFLKGTIIMFVCL